LTSYLRDPGRQVTVYGKIVILFTTFYVKTIGWKHVNGGAQFVGFYSFFFSAIFHSAPWLGFWAMFPSPLSRWKGNYPSRSCNINIIGAPKGLRSPFFSSAFYGTLLCPPHFNRVPFLQIAFVFSILFSLWTSMISQATLPLFCCLRQWITSYLHLLALRGPSFSFGYTSWLIDPIRGYGTRSLVVFSDRFSPRHVSSPNSFSRAQFEVPWTQSVPLPRPIMNRHACHCDSLGSCPFVSAFDTSAWVSAGPLASWRLKNTVITVGPISGLS